MAESIELQSRISYPREPRSGSRYLVSVDLDHALSPEAWPYPGEEYPVTCFLDAAPRFKQEAAGDATIVVHRFGGSYGPAQFWLTAGEPGAAEIRLVLVNSAGVPIAVRTLSDIQIMGREARREARFAAAAEPVTAAPPAPSAEKSQSAFRWLHLGDLHFTSNPAKRLQIADDALSTLESGQRIDAVIVTGDVSQNGLETEFVQGGKFLLDLRRRIADVQGEWPPLLVVPGNHDRLVLRQTVSAQQWGTEEQLRRTFWSDSNHSARLAVNVSFAAYENWRMGAETLGGNVRGLLPGDFAVTHMFNGLRVGIVGLNDSFLTQEFDKTGRADVDVAQLEAVCGNLRAWAGRHDLRILLTHHHPKSMRTEAAEHFYRTIAPRWLFDLHLYGSSRMQTALAEGMPRDAALGINAARLNGARSRQGFRLGEARIAGGSLQVRLWARAVRNRILGPDGTLPDDWASARPIDMPRRPPPPAREESIEPLPPVKNRLALIVGLSDTQVRGQTPGRSHAARDADFMAVTLRQRGYETEQLLQKAATREAILAALERMCEASESDDLLLFYFAGATAVRDEGGWLLTVGASDKQPDWGLALQEIFDVCVRRGRRLLLLGNIPSGAALPIRRGCALLGGPAGSPSKYGISSQAAAMREALEAARGASLTLGEFIDSLRERTNDEFAQSTASESMRDLILFPPLEAAAPEEAPADSEESSGYDMNFLPDFQVRPPMIRGDHNPRNPGEPIGHVLRYDHFSVLTNLERRMPWFVAVNVDLSQRVEVMREDGPLVRDDRLSDEQQLEEEFFRGSPFDRARLVRRLQPAWGEAGVARRASRATAMLPNIVPLVSSVNQSLLWTGLSDHMARHCAADQRLNMLAGPVFGRDDATYKGVQIPSAFWRVFVMHTPEGRRLAAAFIHTQGWKALPQPSASSLKRRPVSVTAQVTIRALEKATGLDFGNLRQFDQTSREFTQTIKPLDIGGRPFTRLDEAFDTQPV